MITQEQLAAMERFSLKVTEAFKEMEQGFNRMARAFAPIARQFEVTDLRMRGRTPMWSRYTLGEKELRRDRAKYP